MKVQTEIQYQLAHAPNSRKIKPKSGTNYLQIVLPNKFINTLGSAGSVTEPSHSTIFVLELHGFRYNRLDIVLAI
jgi:hypothetical protein